MKGEKRKAIEPRILEQKCHLCNDLIILFLTQKGKEKKWSILVKISSKQISRLKETSVIKFWKVSDLS